MRQWVALRKPTSTTWVEDCWYRWGVLERCHGKAPLEGIAFGWGKNETKSRCPVSSLYSLIFERQFTLQDLSKALRFFGAKLRPSRTSPGKGDHADFDGSDFAKTRFVERGEPYHAPTATCKSRSQTTCWTHYPRICRRSS